MRTMHKSYSAVITLVVILTGCHHAKPVSPLFLEECDPAGYISCISQSVSLLIPVNNTGLSLAYSSRWASSAAPGGLGGWSINVMRRYDRENHVLASADGTWRLVDATSLPSGEQAIPSFDGATAYIFDSGGRHLRTVDGHLGSELIKMTYDSAGRLSQIDGSASGRPLHVSVQRGANGIPQALMGIDGGITQLTVDGGGRLVALTNPAGESTSIAWNSAGLVESVTDPAGGAAHFTYDASGNLASTTDADGVVRNYERKTSGDSLEISVSTALGSRWIYRAQSVNEGIRRTFSRPDGASTTQTTDGHGNRAITFADGTTWNVGMMTNPVWGMASPLLTPIVGKRPDGVRSQRELKYNLHPQNGLPYVLAGSLTTTINGETWTQNFDPVQHVAELVDPVGRRTVLSYDKNGQVLSYSAPGEMPTTYSYNALGRMEDTTAGTADLVRTTRYQYDPKTGETITTRPDGVVQKVQRDAAGRTVMISAGDGGTTMVRYNPAGRVNQIQPPGGVNFTLGTSPAGRYTAFVPPIVQEDGSIETTSFDKDGKVTALSGPGTRAISHDYDSAGRVTTSTFDQGKRTISYDPHSGFVGQASDPSGLTVNYGYTGRTLTSLTWSGPVNGSVSVALDANGRGVRESVDGGNNLDFAYDPAGFLTAVGAVSLTHDPASGLVTHTVLGVVGTEQDFDANHQLRRATTTISGRVVLDLRYTRDLLGRVKTVAETESDKTTNTEYSYDNADHLAQVRVNGHLMESNTYDPAGNRLGVVKPGVHLKATYDERDRMTSFGSSRYSWMPDGSLSGLTQGQRTATFVYDAFGGLRQAILLDGRKIEYLVDADGRRIGREIDGKLVAGYLYRSDSFLAAETDAAGKIVARFGYDDAGHLALLERDAVAYRVVTDPLGSPRLVIDSHTGSVVEQMAYDPWGKVTKDTAPGFLPIGFAGGLLDPDTGFLHFGARDYDPQSGRWMAADPIRFAGGQANLCSYVNDDPINARDPSGLCSLWMGGLSVGVSGLPFPVGGVPALGGVGALGLNLQYIQGSGWNVYGSYGGGPGADFGISATGNIGIINNASSQPEHDWEGPTNSVNVGAGPISLGGYASPSQSSNGTSYGGVSAGFGAGLTPVSLSLTRTNTICLTCGSGSGGNSGTGGGGPCPNQPGPNGPGGSGPGGGGNGPGGGGPGGGGGGGGSGGGGNGGGGGGHGPGGGGPGGGGGGGGGGSSGEPHLYTMDGTRFDFQAVGEFLVVASPDGKEVVQARQQAWGNIVTINTAVAANVNGDRVAVYQKEPAFLMVNGAAVEALDMEKRLPHGGVLQRHGAEVVIGWNNGDRLRVTQVANLLNYSFEPAAGTTTKYTGLLGNASGPNLVEARDRSTISRSDPAFDNMLHKQVGNSWRIKQSESLFHYWPGESTAKFTDLNFPPKYVTASSLAADEHSKAESICRAVGVRTQPLLDDCILDVGITGMPAVAAASVGIRVPSLSNAALSSSETASAPAAPSVPDHYTINIGDTVSPDHPGAKAGLISTAGQKQFYEFSAPADANVYVSVGPCGGGVPSFEVHQPDDKLIGGRIGCGDFGPVNLSVRGHYRIVVNSDKPPANYTFTLRPASFDRYSIKIGDAVSPDHPAPGAGIIKDLGQQQSYSFAGRAGETVFLGLGPCEGANPSFKFLRPDNSILDFTISNCHVSLRETLPVSGTYQILASTDRADVNSRYGFFLSSVPPDQRFSTRLPLTVSPSNPGSGAGRVSAAGAEQFYDFTAQSGSLVHIEGKCTPPCPKLLIRAVAVTDTSGYGYWDLDSAKNDWTLPPGGRYTIQVQSTGYVGDYSFTASQTEPQRH